ncbi:alpha-galactosidase [Octadecabacter sp. 1_MG-2023]|uniref:alpha-galactosidase n=1 Tax=unclassified Octadecabacter TaxID=196158 RepID=UPI001C091DF9|nr:MULTISPECIES: alpha-galactosidase [unclassified Octadecabacter]MBU2994622.1 alpha-galactosidase [Octadecabacter sp. B2R22]MDO6734085.1 alpha-galactosidase [Octadecabacter sp. 1_MG-2023]
MIQCWRLDDSRQSLVLGSHKDRLAEVVYWGPRLPDDEDLTTVYNAHAIDVTGGMLDSNPELSLCPEATRSFPGQPGLIARATDGTPLLPKFCFSEAVETTHGLSLVYTDTTNALTYTARFSIHPRTHMIEAQATLEASAPVHLHWLSAPVFPGSQQSDEMIDVAGRWCGEFQLNRTPWSAGIRYRENRTGRTGHEHFPGLIVPCRGATNTQGHAYAFHYGWSGGHRMVAEELPDGRRQIQFGHAARMETEPKTRFETAPLYAVFSDDGINGCGVAFQRHLRDETVTFPNPDRPRPVHYNCWEAIYFNHNLPELKDIADRAAALGAERFVLDDGWFGNRDDDTQALSDWEVDPRKYPDGLTPLIDHIHGLGMTFGIWFEPEMINPDSDVFRANPHWALGSEDQILGRQQMALNMALPDVRDFLFDRISAVLRDNDIEYIKWDHNRVLPMPDAAQTRGSYELIDRLRAAFPDVEIESCASGGGRIDFGILSRTHRVWLSDSNDALERLKMQHNAAIFLPMAVTGSHVGPRKCHTSGRIMDIRFRAWVAAQRHMGFEMDPRELTDEEAGVLKDVTSWWKTNRDWTYRADILRLDSPDDAIVAEQHLSEGGEKFVVFAGKAATSDQISPRPLPLTRLTPDAKYRIELVNRSDAVALSRGDQALKSGPLVLSGGYLMAHGLTLPWSFPDTMWVVEGTLV